MQTVVGRLIFKFNIVKKNYKIFQSQRLNSEKNSQCEIYSRHCQNLMSQLICYLLCIISHFALH